MTTIKIKQANYEVKADEVLEKKVKPYGKGGAHITMPKKHLNKNVLVVIESQKKKKMVLSTGGAMSAWGLSQTKGRKAAEDYLKGK